MENIRMVDEAFLLARIGKMNKGGDGPSREEFNALVERVTEDEEAITGAAEAAQSALDTANGNVFIAEYGVTSAAEIIEYIESEEPFAPILVKRGNDYYTSLIASKKNAESVYLRAVGTASGKFYLYTYTVTGTNWATANYGVQEILVSGETLKTINNESLLGAGNIDIQGGGGDNVFIAEYGLTEYEDIEAAIEADKIIILHDPEMIPEGGSAFLVVTHAEALEGTAILNVYGAKSFGRYQIGMGRWVKSWESLGGVTEKVGYEVEIGSYVDGNGVERALFRKIIDLGALPNNGEKSVAHGIEFGFTITRLDGVMRQANGSALPLPLVTLDTTKMVYISCGRSNVIVQTGSDRSGFTGTVTIEYYYS